MSTKVDDEIQDLIGFLKNPTAYHATQSVVDRLLAEGFQSLTSSKKHNLESASGYFIATEGTVIAFRLPQLKNNEWSSLNSLPFRIWGAHTDSPSLKLKPRAVTIKHHQVQVGVEVYGAPILNTWLDRPLAIAGKIYAAGKSADIPLVHLVNINNPEMMVVIPNASIHLNRNINKGFILSPDIHLSALTGSNGMDIKEDAWLKNLALQCGIEGRILSHDLFLYDPQPPTLLGAEGKGLINSSRLDNLAMVHAGLRGFLRVDASNNPYISTLAFFNHEEIGSKTYEGAASRIFQKAVKSFYQRLHHLNPKLNHQGLSSLDEVNSNFLISADMTHGFHPSYESWYEGSHRPLINGGPVIKYNTDFRYTSTGASSARIKHLTGHVKPHLPLQEYLHHADIPCGSTIGPILSSLLGIPAVDIGNPLWAMHSIRETTGVKDHLTMIELAERFFKL